MLARPEVSLIDQTERLESSGVNLEFIKSLDANTIEEIAELARDKFKKFLQEKGNNGGWGRMIAEYRSQNAQALYNTRMWESINKAAVEKGISQLSNEQKTSIHERVLQQTKQAELETRNMRPAALRDWGEMRFEA